MCAGAVLHSLQLHLHFFIQFTSVLLSLLFALLWNSIQAHCTISFECASTVVKTKNLVAPEPEPEPEVGSWLFTRDLDNDTL